MMARCSTHHKDGQQRNLCHGSCCVCVERMAFGQRKRRITFQNRSSVDSIASYATNRSPCSCHGWLAVPQCAWCPLVVVVVVTESTWPPSPLSHCVLLTKRNVVDGFEDILATAEMALAIDNIDIDELITAGLGITLFVASCDFSLSLSLSLSRVYLWALYLVYWL